MSATTGSTRGAGFLARWLVVAAPLAWGVWQTATTSLALFR